VTVLISGRGKPVTIIARGGSSRASDALRYYQAVCGRRVSFDYEESGHFESVAKRRREAERDAGELVAVAADLGASRAVGASRGARAVVGGMAERPHLFERVVLLLPPGGHAAGRYALWLAALLNEPDAKPNTEVLVIACRGDRGHPVRVAEEWGAALGGALQVFTKAEYSETNRIPGLIASFLNS
jgi:hypothetical protein